MNKNFVLIITLVTLVTKAKGQNFVNPDLNGIITGYSSLPDSWQNVPFTDINCQASNASRDTPDLTDLVGPTANAGIAGVRGNPYSGNTFISSVRSASSMDVFHEGIMQTVTGFIPNNTYTINFQQSVVKQINCLDQSGSWEVYIDNSLSGITLPTFSNAPYNSTSFIWESRSVSFTATASSHTIKFLPHDDDLNLAGSTSDTLGALRMGIDSIYIASCNLPPLNIGNDTTLCEGETLTLDVITSNATYLWQDNSINSTLNVTQQGTYWVQITDNCGSISDTINVNFNVTPTIDLGNDTTLCQGETLTLDASTANATYLWQDNSISYTLNVNQQGKYWVHITDNCGSISDTINVNFNVTPTIDFGNDTTLCEGEKLTLDASAANATYLWQDNSTKPVLNVTQQGTYWVELTVNNCILTDTILIYEECEIVLEIPNVFTPNKDGNNDLFVPIRSIGVVSMNTIIYNRWGNKVFETNKLLIAWDGHDVPDGKYFWIVYYTDKNGIANWKKGLVTLIK